LLTIYIELIDEIHYISTTHFYTIYFWWRKIPRPWDVAYAWLDIGLSPNPQHKDHPASWLGKGYPAYPSEKCFHPSKSDQK